MRDALRLKSLAQSRGLSTNKLVELFEHGLSLGHGGIVWQPWRFAAQQRTSLTRLIEEGLRLRLQPKPIDRRTSTAAIKLPTLPKIMNPPNTPYEALAYIDALLEVLQITVRETPTWAPFQALVSRQQLAGNAIPDGWLASYAEAMGAGDFA